MISIPLWNVEKVFLFVKTLKKKKEKKKRRALCIRLVVCGSVCVCPRIRGGTLVRIVSHPLAAPRSRAHLSAPLCQGRCPGLVLTVHTPEREHQQVAQVLSSRARHRVRGPALVQDALQSRRRAHGEHRAHATVYRLA